MKKAIILTLLLTGCYSQPPVGPKPIEETRTIDFTWVSNDTIEIQRGQTGAHKFIVKCDRSDNKLTGYSVGFTSPFTGETGTTDWTGDTQEPVWTINVNQDTGIYKVVYGINRAECDRLEVPAYIYVK